MKKFLAYLSILTMVSASGAVFSAYSSYPIEQVETFVLSKNNIDFFETFKSYEENEDFERIAALLERERGRINAIFRSGLQDVELGDLSDNVWFSATNAFDSFSELLKTNRLNAIKELSRTFHNYLELALACNTLKIASHSETLLENGYIHENRNLIKIHSSDIKELFHQTLEGDELTNSTATLDWMTKNGRESQGLDIAYGNDLINYICSAAKTYYQIKLVN